MISSQPVRVTTLPIIEGSLRPSNNPSALRLYTRATRLLRYSTPITVLQTAEGEWWVSTGRGPSRRAWYLGTSVAEAMFELDFWALDRFSEQVAA